MPKDTPKPYTPDQLEAALGRLHDFVDRLRATKDLMVAYKIPKILVANDAPYGRAELDLKRWSRAVEDAVDEARKEVREEVDYRKAAAANRPKRKGDKAGAVGT